MLPLSTSEPYLYLHHAREEIDDLIRFALDRVHTGIAAA